MIGVLPAWAAGAFLAVMLYHALRAVSLMSALISDQDTEQVPTRRVVLLQARRGMRHMGCFMVGMGTLLLPASGAMAPLTMGLLMVTFPAFFNADTMIFFIPTSDHDEPIGPELSDVWPMSYLRPAGPVTLDEWLSEG